MEREEQDILREYDILYQNSYKNLVKIFRLASKRKKETEKEI